MLGVIKNHHFIINRENFYKQPYNSDIKRYKEITTGQGEDYTIGCFLDYYFIKNHQRLIAVDQSRQKKLHADPTTIQQIEFIGQLKKLTNNGNATDAGKDQFMFVLTILEKIKETALKFSQRSVTVL